jgi:hypothetical protein
LTGQSPQARIADPPVPRRPVLITERIETDDPQDGDAPEARV